MQVVKRVNNKVNADQGGKLKKTIQRPFRLRTDVSYDCPLLVCVKDCTQLLIHSFVLLLGKTSVERGISRKKTDGLREEHLASTQG